jgi:dipeptidyl-peptidase-4
VGKVYLVGGGPGDPGLITLRGVECLRRADVVFYDGLVNPLLLRHTSATAERTCRVNSVDGRALPQDDINRHLIAAAQQGKTVVRLKGGDPYLFGRGTEEAAALVAAGIPFEVVPGVSAALAASVYAGISLTHRDMSSAVALVTGHENPLKPESDLDYAALSQFTGTLVFYMGLHRLEKIVDALVREGKPADTPTAVICRGTWPQQRTVTGVLSNIAERVRAADLHAPSLIIVGECVKLRDSLQWFELRPLFGLRIGITRPEGQTDEVIDRVLEMGGDPVLLPTIAILPPSDWDAVDQTLLTLDTYDWIVFTSVNGVRHLLNRLWEQGGDARRFSRAKLAAIGSSTAAALADFHLKADLVPESFRAEALAGALTPHVAGRRVLWVRASRGRDILPQEIRAAGGTLDELVVYQNIDVPELPAEIMTQIESGSLHWIGLSSPSIARNFASKLSAPAKAQLGQRVQLASISPVTTAAAQEAGLPISVEATTYTWQGILDAIRLAVVMVLALILTNSAKLQAQGTAADYARAKQLLPKTRNKVFRARIEPHWVKDTPQVQFWYRNDLPEHQSEFIFVDAHLGTRKPAFDHAKLAQLLTDKLKHEISATNLPFKEIMLIDEALAIRFKIDGQLWKFTSQTGELMETKLPQTAPPPEVTLDVSTPQADESPDGKLRIFVRDHNLFLKVKQTNEDIALSTDGTPDDSYEPTVHWSADSKRCVALKTKKAQTHPVYLIESSPQDQVQPKLHQHDYLKPGDRIAQPKPRLFDIEKRQPITVAETLFSNPWSIEYIRWSPDSKRFTFLYNQRGHQALRVITVDATTGEARVLINEESPTFIDYAHKRYSNFLEETNEIVWMSERDGWNQLYLYDGQTGQVKNQITKGNWTVRRVDFVNQKDRRIWFRASGVYPDQDPYYVHYGTIGFDGQGLIWLTQGDGNHQIEFSTDQNFLIDTYSRVDQPPTIELRRVADGSLVCGLEQADWSALLATGWKVPERFSAKGRDGKTDIYGVIYRPTNFDPAAAKKYPVIEYIYAGPHGSFVPKQFSSYHPPQELAELGFIVVQMDGMGTSNRSKAFQDVCYKNLGDSGFPDRILWIKAAAEKHPELDLSRVGIYGGSAGGQSSTRALLAHGDFYHVAVSDCGCHDNRMDKIWWNELWMGSTIGPHYNEQSNVTQAHKLQGKLMLVVGELDRNVDPASSMQVVNALIKADKDFDFLIIPGAGHGACETPYGQRRRQDFFVRHLLGVEPRK